VTDYTIKNKGPIPPGEYHLWPDDISEAGIGRKIMNNLPVKSTDWGNFRVRLFPGAGTKTYGRGGFYLHGGKKPGSAGCIDLGKSEELVMGIIGRKSKQGNIQWLNIEVDYGEKDNP
jgi:hypothetical protein